MNVDLHCHSTFSDGLLRPSAVVERARSKGVDMLALTDHDELGGLAEARGAANALGMTFIDGVEISVSWDDHTIHIIGLGIDPLHPELREGLERIRNTRDSRASRIGESLAAEGIESAYEGALRHAGNPELLSRSHFARFLVEQGHASDVKSVFDHYLVAGKPGYVEHQWASLQEAIGWILRSGGTAVIAHPGRYRLNRYEMRQFISRFKDLGGAGIEVVSGAHSPEQFDEYGRIAIEFGLLASRASDFHGPEESRVELGALPALPPSLQPVWRGW